MSIVGEIWWQWNSTCIAVVGAATHEASLEQAAQDEAMQLISVSIKL